MTSHPSSATLPIEPVPRTAPASGASFSMSAGQPHDRDEGGAAAGQLEVAEGRLPPAQRPRGRRVLVEEAGVAAPQGGGRVGHALVGPAFFVGARINKGTQHGARLGRGAEQRQGRQVSADEGQGRLQQPRVPLHAVGRRGVGAFSFRPLSEEWPRCPPACEGERSWWRCSRGSSGCDLDEQEEEACPSKKMVSRGGSCGPASPKLAERPRQPYRRPSDYL